MELVTVKDLVVWTGGSLRTAVDSASVGTCRDFSDHLVTSICTDSRKLKSGDVFWPLKGERFDGHSFVVAAVESGAHCVICAANRFPQVIEELRCRFELSHLSKLPVLVVSDTLAALAAVAKGYRSRFKIPIVAVTGSTGKTTTKDLTAAVLSQHYCTLKTSGNYNNEVGLPLTLLNLSSRHEAAVVEMGMRGIGQITSLAAIAQPSVGIITNVQPVHIELLGSIEAIAKAKAELVEALPSEGTAVLNWDDEWVRQMADTAPCRVLTYGSSDTADLQICHVNSLGYRGIELTIKWQLQEFNAVVPIPGKHNAYNAAAAILAGIACGINIRECIAGLVNYEGSGLRMEILSDDQGTTIVNDSYNANPEAMRAAIHATLDIAAGRKVWLVLGDMLELGVLAESEHRKLGEWIGRLGIERLVWVGKYGDVVASGAKMAGLSSKQLVVLPDADSCVEYLAQTAWKDRVLLIKGSRGIGLDRAALYCRNVLSK